VPALHHARAMARRARVAPGARADPRSRRDGDSRRDQFTQAGGQSVGVARQYCGTLGKVADFQVVVTAALWTGVRAWWWGRIGCARDLADPRRTRPRTDSCDGALSGEVAPGADVVGPDSRGRLSRDGGARRCGIGDNATLRRTLPGCDCRALGISSHHTVFRGTPSIAVPPPKPGRTATPKWSSRRRAVLSQPARVGSL